MRHLVRRRKALAIQLMIAAILLAPLNSLISCKKAENVEPQKPVQKTFASPADAGTALSEAAKSGDQQALLAIFGADAKEFMSSGDAVSDKDSLQAFAAAYDEMHRWRAIKAGGEMLLTGADNFVFPIPLGQNQAGQWYFDTAAGKDEILARRIGRNELSAIAASSAVARAENEYFSRPRSGDKVRQYSQKLVSNEGKQDGLYWAAAAGQPPSPLEDARDFAKALGYTNAGDKPQPFEGYYFRILTKQGDKAKGGARDYIENGKITGGFAVLAYPIEYRNSGIMTFIVGKDGVVYQKDLGESTTAAAEAITEYNPDDSWKPAS
jgi:Protein of unknown function (DUF2950)